MSKSNKSEAQMIEALKHLEAGRSAADLAGNMECRSTRSTFGRSSSPTLS